MFTTTLYSLRNTFLPVSQILAPNKLECPPASDFSLCLSHPSHSVGLTVYSKKSAR